MHKKQEQQLKLEALIKYTFKNKELLQTAITHSSFANQHSVKTQIYSNERLEFLGDAVLKLIISHLLYDKHPDYDEGVLTKIRSFLVSDQNLAVIAGDLSLGSYLQLSKNEKTSGGEQRPSILANTFEALIGAVYLDGGLIAANEVISFLFLKQLSLSDAPVNNDYKSNLQEVMQKSNEPLPLYTIIKEVGPDHNITFIVQGKINFNQEEVTAFGRGKNKKSAEQNAAKKLLAKIKS